LVESDLVEIETDQTLVQPLAPRFAASAVGDLALQAPWKAREDSCLLLLVMISFETWATAVDIVQGSGRGSLIEAVLFEAVRHTVVGSAFHSSWACVEANP
jgi:hypothetical protein